MKKETKCYDLRLGLDCNLDKDLSKRWGLSQLVKYKTWGEDKKQQGNSIYYMRC